MPSSRHEVTSEIAIIEAQHLLQMVAPTLVLPEARRPDKPTFRQLEIPQYFADGMVVFGDPVDLFAIIETQLAVDSDKPAAWTNYLSNGFREYSCPGVLLVITDSQAVERWANQPIEAILGQPWKPLVLGPNTFPKAIPESRLREAPGLGVICALVHQEDAEAESHYEGTLNAIGETYLAGLLDEKNATLYADAVIAMASQAWRMTMENKMQNAPFLSEIFNKKYFSGVEAGIEEGLQHMRASVREVLKTRGLMATDEQREAIESCHDLDALQMWLRRALTAETADDVFNLS